MEKHHSPEVKKIMSPEEVVVKLRAGIKETYPIEIRGVEINLRVLSADEFNKIRHAAISKMQMLKSGDATDRDLEIQKNVLALASTIQTGEPGIFTDKVLSKMTVDEITYCYDQYIAILEQVNPSLQTISNMEFENIVEALQKKTASARELSIRQSRAICSDLPGVVRVLERLGLLPANSYGSLLAALPSFEET